MIQLFISVVPYPVPSMFFLVNLHLRYYCVVLIVYKILAVICQHFSMICKVIWSVLMWPCAFLFWHVNAKEILVLFCEACVSTNFVKSFLLRFWGTVWSIYSATIPVEISYVCKFDLTPGAIWGSIDWMLDYKATENKVCEYRSNVILFLIYLLMSSCVINNLKVVSWAST